MLKTIFKAAALVVGVVIVAGLGAYALGLRIVLDGAGRPRLQFRPSDDAHAAAIAKHREAQRAQAPVVPTAAPAPADAPPDRAADPVAPAPAVPATAGAAAPAADPAAAPYWTDFRGPGRDGHYRQQPVLTAWPASGLTPIWKQPVGGGYASFVAAGGRAFTIEQRGGEEVVAAYDVTTGREV